MAQPIKINKQHPFPRVPASQCACCSIRLETGYGFEVPYIGVVGPRCKNKFTALAQAIEMADGLSIHVDDSQAMRLAIRNLRITLVQHLGFEASIEYSADGQTATLHIGPRQRKHAALVKSWKQRQAEFEHDLKVAQGDNGGNSTKQKQVAA